MITSDIQELANKVYKILQPYCVAIYLGGSLCQSYIQNPHDVDFICFGRKPVDMCFIRRILYFYFKDNPQEDKYDFIQVRNKQQEEHSYGSYINKEMIKLVGEEIEFTFDVIDKDREEYINILLETIDKLEMGKIKNQKRWYQVIRGSYILKNNSYELSDKEKDILNKVHDQEDGWEQYKKGIKDFLENQLKEK